MRTGCVIAMFLFLPGVAAAQGRGEAPVTRTPEVRGAPRTVDRVPRRVVPGPRVEEGPLRSPAAPDPQRPGRGLEGDSPGQEPERQPDADDGGLGAGDRYADPRLVGPTPDSEFDPSSGLAEQVAQLRKQMDVLKRRVDWQAALIDELRAQLQD